jgi:hypothetical protein
MREGVEVNEKCDSLSFFLYEAPLTALFLAANAIRELFETIQASIDLSYRLRMAETSSP